MRLGLNKFEKEKKVYLNLIDAVDVDFIVVHARVGADTYEVPPDYNVFTDIVAAAKGKPIIANGDITTTETVEKLKAMGVQGVMIGRAAVRDPTIFDKLKGNEVPDIQQVKFEYEQLAEQFNSRFKYRQNVLKRLGKAGERLTKEEYEHVAG